MEGGGTDAYCSSSLSTVYIYGGIVLVAAAAIVACRDCVRRAPLLIVHGLMRYDSVVLGFFLARLTDVSATRFLFVVGGVVRRLAVGLPLCAALLIALRLFIVLLPGCCCVGIVGCSTGSVASTVGAAQDCCCPAYVTRGNECVVLGV